MLNFTTAVILTALLAPTMPSRSRVQHDDSAALTAFLQRFDPIAERGYVKTLRAGSTGIGYTLETLLKIEENNSPRGDFMGMEIKAYRGNELRFSDTEKMNLFLKEPTWLDGLKSAERIHQYGYRDKERQRQAWYQSVTSKTNDSLLRFFVDRDRQRVELHREDVAVAEWTFDVLEKRLLEKHSETVFVAAETRGTGADERFHYQTVTYCAQPSIEKFVGLIESGDVILELRMHVKGSGGTRNHGTAFRVRKNRLADLYAIQKRCRPVQNAAAPATNL